MVCQLIFIQEYIVITLPTYMEIMKEAFRILKLIPILPILLQKSEGLSEYPTVTLTDPCNFNNAQINHNA